MLSWFFIFLFLSIFGKKGLMIVVGFMNLVVTLWICCFLYFGNSFNGYNGFVQWCSTRPDVCVDYSNSTKLIQYHETLFQMIWRVTCEGGAMLWDIAAVKPFQLIYVYDKGWLMWLHLCFSIIIGMALYVKYRNAPNTILG